MTEYATICSVNKDEDEHEHEHEQSGSSDHQDQRRKFTTTGYSGVLLYCIIYNVGAHLHVHVDMLTCTRSMYDAG